MKRVSFIIIIVLSLKMIFIPDCNYATRSADNDVNEETVLDTVRIDDNKETVLDTVRIVFYLDGKQVPYSTFRELRIDDEIIRRVLPKSKDAIRIYGEKFRYGVVFVYSPKKEEVE